MKPSEISRFLQQNIKPLENKFYGKRYRAAARLLDDTYLPCVVFQSKSTWVDLALRRFAECESKPSQYRIIVETFVATGSSIADYKIKTVEPSPFAWPIEILGMIHGETAMSWTAFVVEMKDGSMHSYGTLFNMEFFDLPQSYSYSDISKIHSGMIYSEAIGLTKYSGALSKGIDYYREKPFFTCYLKEL